MEEVKVAAGSEGKGRGAALPHASAGNIRITTPSDRLAQAIEELGRTKRIMLHQERLAALGQMVACIAHEIRNPVNTISTAVQLLMAEGKVTPDGREEFKTILNELARIGTLVNGLTHYARDRQPEVCPVDVAESLQRTLALMQFQLRVEKIAVVLTLPDETVYVKAEPDRLQQVFLNLVCNARDSLNLIRAKKVCGILKYIGWTPSVYIAVSCAGGWVSVAVHDNGVGIPHDLQPKIFTPFFTTKEDENGTGLGLSISRGVVGDFGGTLEVDEDVMDGATFIVKLPLLASG